MLSRPKLLSFIACAALAATPTLVEGQILFTDSAFLAANYTTSGAGTQDYKFNIDYSSLDIFGDGFLTAAIPPSPRGGGTTTGAFVSANNNSLVTTAQSFASIKPVGVNVGTGTANEDYVMRVDVFHSTGEGTDDGAGNQTFRGTTNHAGVAINQANNTVQFGPNNAPGGGNNLTGQGLGLFITADIGAADDYIPVYGGAGYADSNTAFGAAPVAGQFYNRNSSPTINTGLVSDRLNDYWLAQTTSPEFVLGNGLTFVTPTPTNDDLNAFTGDDAFHTPDPTDITAYDETDPGLGVSRQYFAESFPTHSDPFHLTQPSVGPPGFLLGNETQTPGVPYNRWATHEIYWVDGTMTYTITYGGNTIPILQFTPDNSGGVTDNIFSPNAPSAAGAPVLAFWDRFGGSIALDPDGGNFVVFDNLEIEVADAGDVPDFDAYLEAEGFVISEGVPGDFDGDGDVDGRDFLSWQRGVSPTPFSPADLATWQGAYNGGMLSAVSVPEPSSVLLLLSVAGCGLLGRRRG